ncbi:M50 family metallopeptidase [Mycolicibacterium neworleansense]|uniref:Zinc metalloprotease Rip1 n=1 Tax=Mycolicibacterium neworleansense TaxID=146018 RepID=A0A0H5RLJ7_9MYCO|nr:M50 family metallopeptidase [Mycolicibacterium neworleansense]MCV7364238.1 site-2 protease family protein [Mycolicibacterium neworleansense]CRZ15020.1 zinc metalloprotease [Mycolicibacterium neworleansense]
MMFVIGIALFALAILVSVALHECGHMWVARATGMKVRRYFVGFGPTLWSTRRPNKLGETEYGIKAIPLGGFCDIAGMTSVDEIAPEDRPYAMYKQKVWKRVAVLFAGPAMNFIIGLVLLYAIAITWGLPNINQPTTAIVGETGCVAAQVSLDKMGDCTGAGPAALAGIQAGDEIVKVGDTEVSDFAAMADAVRKLNGPVTIELKRDGQTLTKVVDVTQTQRFTSADAKEPATVGAIGVAAVKVEPPTPYNPIAAVPATVSFTGDMAVMLGKSLAKIPTKIGALVEAIGGAERDKETPISVVGASIIGGETVEAGLWVAFWFFLAQLNFVLGAVNLVPLLPFDGGHIAVATYEKLRNMFRAALGKAAAGPVNYLKLMPATYVVLLAVLGYTLLTITADLVNPLSIFQ